MSARLWLTRLVRASALVVVGYAAVLALLWWKQEWLLFMPQPLPAQHRFDLGADVHETWIEVPGARLHALHLRLPKPDGVVFYLHGNAGNLQGWFTGTRLYRQANLDLFMLDYRGYGKSSGHIGSEAQLHADVHAAWDHVAPRYAGHRRVILGDSIGTGLAAALAAQVQPELTVLIAPYSSMVALAGDLYPWVPTALLRYPLRTDQALPRIHGPVLLVHGERDTLIAPAHSQRLLQVHAQATLLSVAGAGHNDLARFAAYNEGLLSALRQPR